MSAAARAVVGAVLAFGAGSAFAQAEAQYVIEQLVVGVSSEADGAGERVEQIKSGDRVEVLERQGDQAHVRLASGREGWVRSSYLSATPPLREQLKARTEELDRLRAEKNRLEADLAIAKKAAGGATNPASSPAASAPAPPESDAPAAASPALPEPAPSNPPMFSPDGMMPARPSWLATIGVSVLALIAGFALGWRVLDKRIRAKYGGLRIY